MISPVGSTSPRPSTTTPSAVSVTSLGPVRPESWSRSVRSIGPGPVSVPAVTERNCRGRVRTSSSTSPVPECRCHSSPGRRTSSNPTRPPPVTLLRPGPSHLCRLETTPDPGSASVLSVPSGKDDTSAGTCQRPRLRPRSDIKVPPHRRRRRGVGPGGRRTRDSQSYPVHPWSPSRTCRCDPGGTTDVVDQSDPGRTSRGQWDLRATCS